MELSNEIVIEKCIDDIHFLQFRKFLKYPQINHAYGLKPLDFRMHQSEEERIVNYQKFLSALSIDSATLVKPNQQHTDCVVSIEKKQNGFKEEIEPKYLEGVDGLMTNKQNITLATTNADCILLLLYDTKRQVIANVHSGWRGTFQKIAQKTVQKMKEEYESDAKDILVGICPSIRVCHFEVDTDVKEMCETIFESTHRMHDIIHQGRVVEGKQKYNIDTVLINQILLEEEGILKENILDSGICSVCQQEKVHSRRAEGIEFGVGSAIIQLT